MFQWSTTRIAACFIVSAAMATAAAAQKHGGGEEEEEERRPGAVALERPRRRRHPRRARLRHRTPHPPRVRHPLRRHRHHAPRRRSQLRDMRRRKLPALRAAPPRAAPQQSARPSGGPGASATARHGQQQPQMTGTGRPRWSEGCATDPARKRDAARRAGRCFWRGNVGARRPQRRSTTKRGSATRRD